MNEDEEFVEFVFNVLPVVTCSVIAIFLGMWIFGDIAPWSVFDAG